VCVCVCVCVCEGEALFGRSGGVEGQIVRRTGPCPEVWAEQKTQVLVNE